MFYHIVGEYIHYEDSFAVIDCAGVGYRLTVSRHTAEALGAPGEGRREKLFTYLQVREDGVELFGFYTQAELDSFRLLISVSGVGPKAAMAILSLLSPDKLAFAIATEDTKLISRANGVGAKTAARIVLELRDKFKSFASTGTSVGRMPVANAAPVTAGGKLGEAMEALAVLGFTSAEATNALRGIDTSAMSVEEIINAALRSIAAR